MPSHFIKPYLMPDTCAGYFLFAGRDRGVPCHILAGTRYHTTRKSASGAFVIAIAGETLELLSFGTMCYGLTQFPPIPKPYP